MRSEAELTAAAPVRLAWLRSQGLGLLCGQATVLLLAVGSVVITATKDGDSARVHFDDLRAFFEAPSLTHLWLYLLVPVLSLYALNTAWCSLDSVVGKWRRGIREPSAYAPALIHLSFLLALLAHGVGGLWNSEGAPMVLGSSWQSFSEGRQARMIDLKIDPGPDGRPKEVQAKIEIRSPDGQLQSATVGYNEPWSKGFGAELLLLNQAGYLPRGARLSSGGADCAVNTGGACQLGSSRFELLALHESGHWGATPVAILRATGVGGQTEQLYLMQGTESALKAGGAVRFEGLETEPALSLRHRLAPGNPWALASVLVLGLGLLLMGRRWL